MKVQAGVVVTPALVWESYMYFKIKTKFFFMSQARHCQVSYTLQGQVLFNGEIRKKNSRSTSQPPSMLCQYLDLYFVVLQSYL